MNSTQVVELLARREGWVKCACNDQENCNAWYAPNDINGDFPLELPDYTSSLDALQPVLATLTTQEWVEVASHAMPPAEISTLPWANFRKGVMMKPDILATCIAKAIKKKD